MRSRPLSRQSKGGERHRDGSAQHRDNVTGPKVPPGSTIRPTNSDIAERWHQ